MLTEELFAGARFSRKSCKREFEWFGNFAGADLVNRNALVRDAALKNHGIQILQASREFGLAAQRIIEFVEFLMNERRFFKIQLFAELIAFGLEIFPQRNASGFQETDQTLHFEVVFFLRATGEAWSEAHFHL